MDSESRPEFVDFLARAGCTVWQVLPLVPTHPGDGSPYNAVSAMAGNPELISLDRLVDAQGAGKRHRYYRIADGTHTDGLYAAFPDRLRPLLPCARSAFDALTGWVERGVEPPPDATYPRPSGDVVNTCTL